MLFGVVSLTVSESESHFCKLLLATYVKMNKTLFVFLYFFVFSYVFVIVNCLQCRTLFCCCFFCTRLCVDHSCAVFNRPSKLLSTPTKARGRPPGSKCPYDLGRMDVEWLTSLNKSQQNKGLMELEEAVLEKALAYIENKVSSD